MSHDPARGVLIIGNGIAGITAARRLRQLSPELRIRIVSDEAEFFFSRTALMYIYMGHMGLQETEPYERSFYKKNRLEIIHDRVTAVDPVGRSAVLRGGARLDYDALLLATGARYNRFGWPGQDLKGAIGLYSLPDLRELEELSGPGLKEAVIVGGGLIGIELAEMLHTRGVAVTMLVRESGYWGNILPPEESRVVEAELRRHHIALQLNTELKAIEGDSSGRVCAITSGAGERLPAQLVGLTAGVSPNLELAAQIPGLQTKRGVRVDRWLRTSCHSVFAAGDCAELLGEDGAGRVEQLWYTGRMQGEAAANSIGWMLLRDVAFQSLDRQASAYERGIWFNSAKFFQIEYQTYGFVPNNPEPTRSHVWTSADHRRLIRLCWDESGAISGFNFLGLRYRQEICVDWIKNRRAASAVAAELHKANFDPEFSARFEGEFLQSFEARRNPAGAMA